MTKTHNEQYFYFVIDSLFHLQIFTLAAWVCCVSTLLKREILCLQNTDLAWCEFVDAWLVQTQFLGLI